MSHTNTRQEHHHKRPHQGPPHLTTIEGGAATVRTTVARMKEKHVTHTNTRQEEQHKRPHEGPPHLTTIEGGAVTVRTTSHTLHVEYILTYSCDAATRI